MLCEVFTHIERAVVPSGPNVFHWGERRGERIFFLFFNHQ